MLGVDEPRIRSWQLRMLLDDQAAASARFADYAAMSAYTYALPADRECGIEPKLSPEDERELVNSIKNMGWHRVSDAEFVLSDQTSCEDEVGLFFHVWRRDSTEKTEVVIAFRGTWGFNDWWYGNSYWARRFFTDMHQYAAARSYAKRVIQHFQDVNFSGKTVEFSSTGHSLGGGLAQAVLYDQIKTVGFNQAYAFAPSSATAYTTRSDKSTFGNCSCNEGYPEPRIYRVYESHEILANLRIFHKLAFPPEPWINEVRFSYEKETNAVAQHSMSRFALALLKSKAKATTKKTRKPWFASSDKSCTSRFEESQNAACIAVVCDN